MTKEKNNKEERDSKGEIKFLKFILIAVVILIAGYFALSSILDKPKIEINQNKKTEQKQEKMEPQFTKEGSLTFIKKGSKKLISDIEIEIADNDSARMYGLMFRKSMPENRGMLFIFEKEEMQSFWMKNTIISLDLIYVNENFEIVSVHKNAKPYSTESIPSGKPAKYVVEVISGYTDKYKIAAGDLINFEKDNK